MKLVPQEKPPMGARNRRKATVKIRINPKLRYLSMIQKFQRKLILRIHGLNFVKSVQIRKCNIQCDLYHNCNYFDKCTQYLDYYYELRRYYTTWICLYVLSLTLNYQKRSNSIHTSITPDIRFEPFNFQRTSGCAIYCATVTGYVSFRCYLFFVSYDKRQLKTKFFKRICNFFQQKAYLLVE